MSRFARVTSIGVLQTVASALLKFRGEAAAAMDDLEAEIRRALEWIHHDRKEYWAQEVRRSWEAVSQARIQLQQARVARRIAGHEPECIDEQRALEQAKRRLERAEETVRAVQHWAQTIDHAVEEFRQSRVQFTTWLDTDLLRATAALNRMSESLDGYVSLEPPADSGAPLRSPDSATCESEDVPSKDPPPAEEAGR
jgi:hypothetical protein